MQTATTAGPVTYATAAPAWARTLRRFNDWWLTDIGGGPRVLKFAWVINTQQAGTFMSLGALMFFYASRTPTATSLAAWIYLAMPGSYGLVRSAEHTSELQSLIRISYVVFCLNKKQNKTIDTQ